MLRNHEKLSALIWGSTGRQGGRAYLVPTRTLSLPSFSACLKSAPTSVVSGQEDYTRANNRLTHAHAKLEPPVLPRPADLALVHALGLELVDDHVPRLDKPNHLLVPLRPAMTHVPATNSHETEKAEMRALVDDVEDKVESLARRRSGGERRDTGLRILARGVDLDIDVEGRGARRVEGSELLLEYSGKLFRRERLNNEEVRDGLRERARDQSDRCNITETSGPTRGELGLVGLQSADKVPFDVLGELDRETDRCQERSSGYSDGCSTTHLGRLLRKLLDIVLAKVPVAVVVKRHDVRGGLQLSKVYRIESGQIGEER